MGAPPGLAVAAADPPESAVSHDPDALIARLAARVGGAWVPSGPGARSMEERGLHLLIGVTVGEEGAGKLRIEVRPVVGWGWYVPVLLLPLIPLRLGFPWYAAVAVALGGGFLCRGIGRAVMRVRGEARKAQLQRALGRALEAES